jgi:hypothetical protein
MGLMNVQDPKEWEEAADAASRLGELYREGVHELWPDNVRIWDVTSQAKQLMLLTEMASCTAILAHLGQLIASQQQHPTRAPVDGLEDDRDSNRDQTP